MIGEEQPLISASYDDPSGVGMIPRALAHLFDRLRQQNVEFSMRVSYLELYNEELCDLLSTDDTVKIRIFDDVAKKGSVIVQGLEEIPVRCKNDVYKLLAKGQERRKTAATLMNAQSSRSHTVFSILVHIKENSPDGEELLKIGKLNLVDLAGSENISKAGNEKGIRTRESVNINQSLLTLGRVITALVERAPHVPYRESKLTRLLQESLGGRTKTSIIATISCGHKDLEETLSTLDYAHRAKNIQNRPEINQRLTKKVMLREYTEEIDRLKRDLIAAREKNGIYLATDTYEEMEHKLESQQTELNEISQNLKSAKEELTRKTSLFDECQASLRSMSELLVVTEGKYNLTESELKKTKRNLKKTERHYTEAKHLIVCHQETENKLTEHAKDIMKIADEASKDTLCLQENINRRKDKDERALTLTEKMIESLSNNLLEMRAEMQELKRTHTESCKFVQTDLDEYLSSHKTCSNLLRECLKEQKEWRESSGSRLMEKFEEWKNSFESSGEKTFDSLFKFVNDLVKAEKKVFSDNEEKMENLEKIVSERRNAEEKMEKFLVDKINEQHEKVAEFCEDMRLKFEEYKGKIDEVSSSMKSKADLRNLKIKEMKKMLEDLDEISKEDEVSHKRLNDVTSEISEYIPAAKRFKVDYSAKIEKIHQEVEAHSKNRSEKDSEIDVNIKDARNAIKSHSDTAQSNLETQTDTISNIQSSSKNQLNSIKDTLVNHSELNLAKQQEQGDKFAKQIQEISSLTAIKMQGVKSVVQQNLNSLVLDTESKLSDNFDIINSEIEEYQNAEIFKYKSTGDTPARKDYKYNKQLSTTSPHERLIRKLRLEQGLSDSLLHDSSLIEVRKVKENNIKHLFTSLSSNRRMKHCKTLMKIRLRTQHLSAPSKIRATPLNSLQSFLV